MNLTIEQLIEKVRLINPEAAEYLYTNYRNTTKQYPTIDNLFVWANTPQGWEFWNNIERQIDYYTILELTPEQKQTRIQRKIKSLWNNSNWVKANPSQAY